MSLSSEHRAEYKRAWSQRRYERREAEGLCVRCGGEKSRRYLANCDDCSRYIRRYQDKKRSEARLAAAEEFVAQHGPTIRWSPDRGLEIGAPR